MEKITTIEFFADPNGELPGLETLAEYSHDEVPLGFDDNGAEPWGNAWLTNCDIKYIDRNAVREIVSRSEGKVVEAEVYQGAEISSYLGIAQGSYIEDIQCALEGKEWMYYAALGYLVVISI